MINAMMRKYLLLAPWLLLSTAHCGGEVNLSAAAGTSGTGGGGGMLEDGGGIDAAEDASGGTGAGGSTPEDAGSPMDGGWGGFPSTLEGIWLIGWSGGLNHYSWVRFVVPDPGGGDADFLSGDTLSVNAPYWNCSGKGSWALTQKPDTVQLFFPASCGVPSVEVYTFLSLMPVMPGGYPKGAILAGNVQENPQVGMILEAYKFAPTQCDAAMTSCTDPFL